jgi:hypothetical protein
MFLLHLCGQFLIKKIFVPSSIHSYKFVSRQSNLNNEHIGRYKEHIGRYNEHIGRYNVHMGRYNGHLETLLQAVINGKASLYS